MGKNTNYLDFRDALFEELFKLAKRDKNVVILMADQEARSFEKFRRVIPSQLFNVGVAEQNMISLAAGMALLGKKVYVHAIANFATLRCYEQIKVDLSIMNLPVVITGVGAGFAYGSDGPTHHANQDLAVMRAIPNMTILNACDTISLSAFPALAYRSSGPVYIRFDKDVPPLIYKDIRHSFDKGLCVVKPGRQIMIISTGLMVAKALEIAAALKVESIDAAVIDLYRLKPLNEKLMQNVLKDFQTIVTLEEHLAYGAVGTIVSDFLCDFNLFKKFKRFGLEDKNYFIYGDREYMHKKAGLLTETIIKKIIKFVKN